MEEEDDDGFILPFFVHFILVFIYFVNKYCIDRVRQDEDKMCVFFRIQELPLMQKQVYDTSQRNEKEMKRNRENKKIVYRVSPHIAFAFFLIF